MTYMKRLICVSTLLVLLLGSVNVFSQKVMENLGRGVIALRQSTDSVFISWRMLGTDPDDIAFNLYRTTGNKTTKLNDKPLTQSTCFVDTKAKFSEGVAMTKTSGDVSGSTNPLIVVDGTPSEVKVPYDFNFSTADQAALAALLKIAPTDIRDIAVLKNTSATSIWGSRGANGVIVINTKKAPGKASGNYKITSAKFLEASPMAAGEPNAYFVKAVIKGKEGLASKAFTLAANAPVRNYLSIPLQTPKPYIGPDMVSAQNTPRPQQPPTAGNRDSANGNAQNARRQQQAPGYTPNDASVGDLDGDGEYEIIVHQAGRGRDNPSNGFTDPPIFQAYKLDGTLMWTINLGRNIREGAHYTQWIVMDLDGDGKAEVAMKTADGTIDGKGKVIGDSSKNWVDNNGKILKGPEFFTIFSGLTGVALATTDYIPNRYPTEGWGGHGGNGGTDNNGNRVDRFLAGVAYLDGKLPSVIMCRGYYGRSVIAAWDWRGGKLTSRWVFDSKDGENPFSGQGYHALSIADVDGDGKDEVVYGSMVIDDNGKGLFSTGLRHGDALHVSDLDPSRPGLEVFGIHEIEENTKGPGAALYDAKTGKILWTGSPNVDVGRGVAENIDPENPGAEMWWSGSDGLYNLKGEKIGPNPPSTNFLIHWDGDLTRELLDGNHIDKYKVGRIFTAEGCTSNNGSKSTPALSADILGDWREELIERTTDNKELRIFSTTIPTTHRMYTLMHDPQYRVSIAWQNVGYNQPPHTSFYMGEDMKKAPKPNIVLVKPSAGNKLAANTSLTK